ncbi:MAG: hypothetical protein AVDCRST_MAG69-1634, partial [uncultured Solirubrobacteraceae bacterium]
DLDYVRTNWLEDEASATRAAARRRARGVAGAFRTQGAAHLPRCLAERSSSTGSPTPPPANSRPRGARTGSGMCL